ncbi:hypothetical protein GGI22_007549, partial [Coemansia erecta]
MKPLSTPKSTKEQISLSIGDPTVFGNFKTHPVVVESVEKAVRSFNYNGYPPSVVEMAIGVLCSEGQNILLPRPGFCLYNTIAGSRNIDARLYNLLADKNWEVDIAHMESLIDANTAAILINNPSNPCGSNFTKAHLKAILAVCEKHKIPLISDEIYADMVFSGQVFTPTATLTSTVPILTLGGLAKQWLVPGWRIGWILVNDRNRGFDNVRKGLFALSTLINGP